jgi:hypothetical protein
MVNPALFGLVCVAVMAVNGAMYYSRADRFASNDAERQSGRGLAIGLVAWVAPLFLLEAAGQWLGWTGLSIPPAPGDHARGFDWLVCMAIVFVLSCGTFWIFRRGGAVRLAAQHAVFGLPRTPRGIKIWWVVIAIAIAASNVFAVASR